MSRHGIIRILTAALATALLVCSCDLLNGVLHNGDRKVARVGRSYLYESDVVPLVPKGFSPADSSAMAEQYVKSWAVGKLMEQRAYEMLGSSERDVSQEVEEFRQRLLSYRYEKHYVEEHLDTVVTAEAAQEYYEKHPQNYKFPYTIIRARAIRISPKSPYYDAIKESYAVTSESGTAALEEMCAEADRYVDFGKQWVEVSALSRELGVEQASLEREIASKKAWETKIDGANWLICILDRAPSGSVTPIDYNLEDIKEAIISKRKQELLDSLEQELLEEALVNNKFKIFDNE